MTFDHASRPFGTREKRALTQQECLDIVLDAATETYANTTNRHQLREALDYFTRNPVLARPASPMSVRDRAILAGWCGPVEGGNQ